MSGFIAVGFTAAQADVVLTVIGIITNNTDMAASYGLSAWDLRCLQRAEAALIRARATAT